PGPGDLRVPGAGAPVRGAPGPGRAAGAELVTAHAAPRIGVRLTPLMVRVVCGLLLLLAVVGLILLGLWGIWVIVAALMGLALWEFRRLSEGMGFQAPIWLLFPLAFYLAFSSTLLKAIPLELVLALALILGLTVFLFLPGR